MIFLLDDSGLDLSVLRSYFKCTFNSHYFNYSDSHVIKNNLNILCNLYCILYITVSILYLYAQTP